MRTLKLIGLLLFTSATAWANTAITLYDNTTNYAQIHSPGTYASTYKLIMPITPGATNQVMAIQSVAGATATLSFVNQTGGGGNTGLVSLTTGTIGLLNLQTQVSGVLASTSLPQTTTILPLPQNATNYVGALQAISLSTETMGLLNLNTQVTGVLFSTAITPSTTILPLPLGATNYQNATQQVSLTTGVFNILPAANETSIPTVLPLPLGATNYQTSSQQVSLTTGVFNILPAGNETAIPTILPLPLGATNYQTSTQQVSLTTGVFNTLPLGNLPTLPATSLSSGTIGVISLSSQSMNAIGLSTQVAGVLAAANQAPAAATVPLPFGDTTYQYQTESIALSTGTIGLLQGSKLAGGSTSYFQGLFASGNALITTSATFVAGTNVTLSQSGSSITINSSSSGGTTTILPLPAGATNYFTATQLVFLSTGTSGLLPGSQLAGASTSYLSATQSISFSTGIFNLTNTSSFTIANLGITGSSLAVNGVWMAFPATPTVGGYLQYQSSNTVQWGVPPTGGGGGGTTILPLPSGDTTYFTQTQKVSIATGTFNDTMTSSFTFTNSVVFATQTVITSTFTITSTMTVVEASSTLSALNAFLPLTLPVAATVPGQIIMVSKVDSTTAPVRVYTQPGDVFQSTGIWIANAYQQQCSFQSLGAAGWGVGPAGCQWTPPRIEVGQSQSGAFVVSAASGIVVESFYISVPIAAIGVSYEKGIGKTNTQFGSAIYDANGAVICSTTTAANATAQPLDSSIYAFNSPCNLGPGQYYLAVQISNVLASVSSMSNANGSAPFCSKAAPSSIGFTAFAFGSQASTCFYGNISVAGGRPIF